MLFLEYFGGHLGFCQQEGHQIVLEHNSWIPCPWKHISQL